MLIALTVSFGHTPVGTLLGYTDWVYCTVQEGRQHCSGWAKGVSTERTYYKTWASVTQSEEGSKELRVCFRLQALKKLDNL